MFKSSCNYSKLKTNLRLVINRLKLLEKKKTELALKARKEIADYISAGKEDRARIRVEHIIREDYLVEAMELLEMYCDLLLARFGLIQTQKELDPGLEEAIASVIWATPRLQADVMELKTVTIEFSAKYGKEFAQACRTNALNNVSEKVMHKLSVQAPPRVLVERYMVEIAKTYNIPFEPDPVVMTQDEIFAAENMLIDFGDEKKGKGGSGGPSGGMGALEPIPANNPPYPPQVPSSGKVAPPLPDLPPAACPSAPAPYPQPTPYPMEYPNPGMSQPPPPPANQLYNEKPIPMPRGQGPSPVPKFEDNFPDLPPVPNSSLPDIGNTVGSQSAGGEDVDFDDLTKRFEALKKKK